MVLIPKDKHQTKGVKAIVVDNINHRAIRYFGIKVELYKSKWAKRTERRLDFSAALQLGFSTVIRRSGIRPRHRQRALRTIGYHARIRQELHLWDEIGFYRIASAGHLRRFRLTLKWKQFDQ